MTSSLDIPSKENLKCEILPEEFTQYDLSFKIIVIGDAGVGKSCLTLKAIKDYFDEDYNATVGFEFFSLTLKLQDKYVKLQIWDTCGQEVYRSLISSFYRNSSLAMMVYSIENEESFAHIDSWLKEVKTQSNPDVKIFLLGNKSDLEDKRKVARDVVENYVKDNNIDYFLETSAKSGFNARNAFMEAGKVLYLEHLKYKDRSSRPGSLASVKGITLPQPSEKDKEDKEKNTKKSCC